jgi:hypothetical protein
VSEPPIGLDDLASADGGDTVADPVSVALSGSFTNDIRESTLSTIAEAGKYVSLDLSACEMTDTEFDPGVATEGADKITALVLPNTAKSIQAGTASNPTFSAFTSLTSIDGASVEIIGTYAFRGCVSLTEVNLPAATTIGNYALSSCAKLTEANLPVVTTIGNAVFYNCPNLTTITVDPANTVFTVRDGMLLNKAETTLIAYPSASGDITLPSVIKISVGAFRDCTNLTSVSLPTATTIGNAGFLDCTSLTAVSLPAMPPSISNTIFYGTGYNSSGTITISVPTGAVSAYTSTWGVDADTPAGGNTSVYGGNHKAVLITDAAQ